MFAADQKVGRIKEPKRRSSGREEEWGMIEIAGTAPLSASWSDLHLTILDIINKDVSHLPRTLMDGPEIDLLVESAVSGDSPALEQLYDQYRERLHRVVNLRLDARVRGRIDASDVVQETFVEVARRLPEFSPDQEVPFFVWLRGIAVERLIQLHRTHLGAQKRSVKREVSIDRGCGPEASSIHLASILVGQFTSVDRPMKQEEVRAKVENALNSMDEADREIIAMRHFEGLSTEEIAKVLGMTKSGVLKRHTRAVQRLSDVINSASDLSFS